MAKNHVFNSLQDECNHLGSKAFSIIELVEVSNIPKASFEIIRKKLLNLGNDIIRLADKHNPHMGCFCEHCNPPPESGEQDGI